MTEDIDISEYSHLNYDEIIEAVEKGELPSSLLDRVEDEQEEMGIYSTDDF